MTDLTYYVLRNSETVNNMSCPEDLHQRFSFSDLMWIARRKNYFKGTKKSEKWATV